MEFCSLCRMPLGDDAELLTCSGYGNPRRICPECGKLIQTLTLGKDYDEIHAAGKTLVKTMDDNNIDDELITETMDALFVYSAERADKIKKGTYDFAQDEDSVLYLGDDEGIPEELQETEEDKELDRIEKEKEKKFNTILNYAWLAFAVAFVGYVVYRFFIR